MAERERHRQESIELLKRHGWSSEQAEAFLDDKVGARLLRIPGQYLLDVLKEVCKEGIPFGDVEVSFLVPKAGWERFKKTAEEAIGKHGGFVFTPEEKAFVTPGPDPETRH